VNRKNLWKNLKKKKSGSNEDSNKTSEREKESIKSESEKSVEKPKKKEKNNSSSNSSKRSNSSMSYEEKTKTKQENLNTDYLKKKIKCKIETVERKEDNVTIIQKTIEEEKEKPEIFYKKKLLMNKKDDFKDLRKTIENIVNGLPKEKTRIEKLIRDIEDDKDGKKKKFFKKQGYILTQKSKERLALLIDYLLNGIFVLLEGNTGSSKTRTALTACKYISKFMEEKKNIKLIRYNLSAETKIDDLIAKYVSDNNSFVGLKVQYGPFVEAYINGDIILFDELNLASPNILQCIQQSLDNGFISVETNGICLLKKDKHPNFGIIATQNPNKNAFEGKRQELGPEFLSRFQKIYFPDISKTEMHDIALGIAENSRFFEDKENKVKKKKLLEDIVNFHFDWEKEVNTQNNIQCFTIREIESVIECLSNKENIFESIMTIYGGRFKEDIKEKLKRKLKNYETLKYIKDEINYLPKNFPKCFKNTSLIRTVNYVLLSLRNKRNVIIVGNNESGLTQIAEWCSECYTKNICDSNQKEKDNLDTNICFCTKNLEFSDLIGTQKNIRFYRW